MNFRSLVPPLLAATLWMAGCPTIQPGPERHESRAVERDAAERVKAILNMGAGRLTVRGGARKLMEAEFAYSTPFGRPEVTYRSTGALGTLTLDQPASSGPHAGNSKCEWDLALNNEVPLDLSAHFGAGEARLDLGDLTLRNVEVHMGVGRLELDLRGHPKGDFAVQIEGGVGEANVRLPLEAGLEVRARGGLGAIHVRGLRQEEGRWVNDARRDGAANIRVDIRGGIGAINVTAE
jgi:hypothetical protein